MKRTLCASLLSICVSIFPSCGVAYRAQRDEILKKNSDADFSPAPPADREKQERDLILSVLKDPDSAKLAFLSVEKDAIQKQLLSPEAVPVWVSNVSVNAKNSFGGYTGAQPWRIAWHKGQLFAYSAGKSRVCYYLRTLP